jgi:hypothetical protein
LIRTVISCDFFSREKLIHFSAHATFDKLHPIEFGFLRVIHVIDYRVPCFASHRSLEWKHEETADFCKLLVRLRNGTSEAELLRLSE